MFFDKPIIAIDIGSYAVKIAEISYKTRPMRVISAGIRTLPPGAIIGGNIQDAKIVELTIMELLKELHIGRFLRRAGLGMGGSNAIVKRLKIAKNDTMDSRDQVYLEAEKQIQMDMNELYFDFSIENLKSDKEINVIVAATKRDILDERIDLVLTSGLKIGVVDADVLALTNLMEYNFGLVEGMTAIVNIGHGSTTVVFLENGHFVYAREIGVGGEHYTKALSENMGTSIDIAEETKIQVSMKQSTADELIKNTIESVNEQFYSEYQLAVDFFFQSGEAGIGKERLKTIYLSGGGSMVLGLQDYMTEKLGIPISRLDPFQKMDISRSMKGYKNLMFRPIFAVAAGLCLRRYDEKINVEKKEEE